MITDQAIENLAEEYLKAKEAETVAIETRRKIGELLIAALPGKDEGTTSVKLDGCKITVTRKLTRKVDSDALGKQWDSLTESVRNTFKWSADVNIKHLRALQELASPDMAEASKFFSTKHAAASVSVDPIKE